MPQIPATASREADRRRPRPGPGARLLLLAMPAAVGVLGGLRLVEGGLLLGLAGGGVAGAVDVAAPSSSTAVLAAGMGWPLEWTGLAALPPSGTSGWPAPALALPACCTSSAFCALAERAWLSSLSDLVLVCGMVRSLGEAGAQPGRGCLARYGSVWLVGGPGGAPGRGGINRRAGPRFRRTRLRVVVRGPVASLPALDRHCAKGRLAMTVEGMAFKR